MDLYKTKPKENPTDGYEILRITEEKKRR